MCVFLLMSCVVQLPPVWVLQSRPWDPQGGSQRAVQTGQVPGEAGAGTQQVRHRPAQTADVST